LSEFFINRFAEFGRRTDHYRTAVRTAVLVAEVILIAPDILGQDNIRSWVPFHFQAPQVATKRDAPPSLAAFHCLGESGLSHPTLYCSNTHSDESSDLHFRALQHGQFFYVSESDVYRPSARSCSLPTVPPFLFVARHLQDLKRFAGTRSEPTSSKLRLVPSSAAFFPVKCCHL
jgi:hypothetical protein